MKKHVALAVGVALAMASAATIAPLALAAASVSEVITIGQSMRASKLIGMTVHNGQGTAIGKFETSSSRAAPQSRPRSLRSRRLLAPRQDGPGPPGSCPSRSRQTRHADRDQGPFGGNAGLDF
jgi:hypothetical protein